MKIIFQNENENCRQIQFCFVVVGKLSFSFQMMMTMMIVMAILMIHFCILCFLREIFFVVVEDLSFIDFQMKFFVVVVVQFLFLT